METPILATKLYIPSPRPKIVRRPHLIERLNDGLHRKLTLISAPAGFGKTTLVSDWVAGSDRPAAWLSLDKGDSDLNHFLVYFVAALQKISDNFGEGVLEMLQSPPPVPTEPILTALLNEIAAFPSDFILVLDDYHVIDAQPVDDALSFLLEYSPPHMHLVIATRKDPKLPLARLRVRDHLTELRVAELRFSTSETAGFLNLIMALNLTEGNIAALESRTEGWIAGLQLAAISMKGLQDTSGFIKSFTGSNRFVLDYLVEEILHQQPEDVQNFLLKTSILDRLYGPLCDAVLLAPPASGQATLEYLERANLLIIPLDEKRKWYRYHHLFAEALRARLEKKKTFQSDRLHMQACEWYVQNNFRSDAIRHALAAKDFERAAGLIELEWSIIRRSCFRSPTWLGWVQGLPDDLVRLRPVLSVGYAWELLNFGVLDAAEDRIREAELWLEPGVDVKKPEIMGEMVVVNEQEFGSLRGLLANARAYHAQALGDVPGTVKHARRALALGSGTDYYTRGIASSLLGLASWTKGDLETAYNAVSEGLVNLRLAGNILFSISGTFFVAEIKVAQGRLREAINIYEKGLQLTSAQGEPVLQGMANLYLGLSEVHRERGDSETANQYLLKSEVLGESAALLDWQYRLCLAKARIKQIQRNWDDAIKLYEKAERLYYSVPVPDVRPIGALKACVWIEQGRLNEAVHWVEERGLRVDDELSYLREFEHLTLARVLIVQYQRGEGDAYLLKALGLLERLLIAAEAGERTASVIDILIVQALANVAHGDSRIALKSLHKALELAEPESYVRRFVDEGTPMKQLLSEVAAQNVASEYTTRLLAAFEIDDQGSEESSPTQSLIESLSERELEILRLIAQGLSNREISTRLFLALSTIKGHNQKIFGKLRVQRRTEAVARARKLGLL